MAAPQAAALTAWLRPPRLNEPIKVTRSCVPQASATLSVHNEQSGSLPLLTLEHLSALDLQAWLGSQREASLHLGYSQSQISRKSQQGLRLLMELGVKLNQPAPDLHHDCQGLLNKLRGVHQWMRFRDRRDLRLQSSCWMRHLALEPMPEGWIANSGDLTRFNDCDVLSLLEHRLIDAALVTGPECPPDAHPSLCRLELSRQPLLLLVPRHHRLADECGLRVSEIAANSELAHSSFVPSRCRQVMEQLDSRLVDEARRSKLCTLRSEPPGHTRRYGTAMTCLIRPDLMPLDFAIPHPALDVLVVHRDWADHAAISELITVLRQRLDALKPSIAGLELSQ